MITATSEENPEVQRAFTVQVGTGGVTPSVKKLANPMKVTVTNPTTVKFSKKKQTIKAAQVFTITKAQGKVTFSKKSGAAALSIKPNGNIVVAKNAKKGTYNMKVVIKAAGNSKYVSIQHP